jgi:hypothetical protein
LVDDSAARNVATEDQLIAEVDNLYAQRLVAYLASLQSQPQAPEEGDLHPFLDAALLAAVVLLLRRAFRAGVVEGLNFGGENLSKVGITLDPSLVKIDNAFSDSVVTDFLQGQVNQASSWGSKDPQVLAATLSQRADLGVLTAFHGGRNAASEASFAQAPGQVHKLWVARFDLETAPCSLCVRLHGMHVPLADNFHVHDDEPGPYLGTLSRPPRHPRCRCSVVLYMPTEMKTDSGPAPLSMVQYADQVLRIIGAERHDFIAASVVRVEGYTRVVGGKTEQVSGYFYDIKTGLKVPSSQVPGNKAPKVSLQKARAMEQKAKSAGVGKTSGGPGQAAAVWPKGTYHINMPDGSVTQVIVSDDGSSRATSNGQTENADPAQTHQFMSYWQEHLQQVDNADSGLHDVQHPEHNIGGVSVTSDHVKEAISILKNEPSTSVKAPLKIADHPLASADLRGFATEHAGTPQHYSKLKQGVIDALQAKLKGKDGAQPNAGKPEAPGAPTPPDAPSAPSAPVSDKQKAPDKKSVANPPSAPNKSATPPAVPADQAKTWKDHLENARVAFKVSPQPGDHGSGIAAAQQRVATTRHKYYVRSDQGNTQISMKPLPVTGNGHDLLVHSNGSVYSRSLDGSGAEQLHPMSPDEVSSLTSPHFQSSDKVSLDRALSNPRSIKDNKLDGLMQEALTSNNMDAFDKLAAEADRRSASEKRSSQQEEQRAAQLEKLLMEGKNESDAIEKVYGVSGEGQKRKLAITSLRSDGYTGVNLSELARKAFRDDVYSRYIEAENSMQGHMLSKEGEAKNISPVKLFTGSEATAMKYASPELIDYWGIHGRPSFDEWLNDFMGGFGSSGGA